MTPSPDDLKAAAEYFATCFDCDVTRAYLAGLKAGREQMKKLHGTDWASREAPSMIHCRLTLEPGPTLCGIEHPDVMSTLLPGMVSCPECLRLRRERCTHEVKGIWRPQRGS